MTVELIDIARSIANRFTNQPSTITGTHALWDRDGMRLALVKIIVRYILYCDQYHLETSDADLIDFITCNQDFTERYGMRAPQLYTGMIIGIAAHLNMFELMPTVYSSSNTNEVSDMAHMNGIIPEYLKGISIFDLLDIEPIKYAETLISTVPCLANSYAFLSSIHSRSFSRDIFRGLKSYDHLFGWSEYAHSLARKALLLPGIKQVPSGIVIDDTTLMQYYTSRTTRQYGGK